MTPYRRGRVWWFRLYNSRGESEGRSSGTRDKATAKDMEAMCDRLRSRRQWAVLDALFERDIPLGVALDHDAAGTLDELTAQLTDVDLSPLLDEWAATLRARFPDAGDGPEATPIKYPRNVRRFVEWLDPRGVLQRSRFTTAAVDRFTASLAVKPATVNRYLAALSSFGKYATARGELAKNPVEGATWPAPSSLTKRTRHLTFREQMRLIDGAERGSAVQVNLVLAHLGFEWTAVWLLTRADVDFERHVLRARGTKTRTRDRMVRLEAWAAPYLRDALGTLLPDAPVIATLDPKCDAGGQRVRRQIARLAAKLGIADYTPHDGRHTLAVRHYAAGVPPHAIGRALGHKDGSEVVERYGVYEPTPADMERYERMAEARDADETKVRRTR
jgi:integrase